MSRVVQDPPEPLQTTGVAAPATAAPGSAAPAGAERFPAERWGWTLVWLGLLTGGVNVWGFWWSSPLTVVLAAVMVLGGIAGMVATWVVSPRAGPLQWLGQLGALTCAAFPQAVVIHTSTYYHTDSAAFVDVSAHALLHGENPYTTSMAAAARLLRVPDRYWTYTTTGSHVAHASYPAGSFLVDMPALLLGLGHHVVDWMDLAAWLVTGVLVFVLLPVTLRWLAALVTLTPIFIGMFGNSGTDASFLPFLVLAVWRWDRFGQGSPAGVARWLGPVALGLACSVKQLPWFCVPVLATGVALEARARGARPAGVVTRYLAMVAGAFAAVNVAFVVWSPGPWLHGTLTPFVDPLVADGQGLVSLATHGLTGGVDLTDLTLAGALAYLGTVVAFVAFYHHLKRIWPLVLPVVFFFSVRSLSSYLVDLFPVAVLAITSVATVAPPGAPRRAGAAPRARPAGGGRRAVPWRPAAAVGALAVGVVVASALAFSSAPLQLQVRAVQTSHGGHALRSVTLTVRNRTGRTLVPHFLVNTGANPNGFWNPPGGVAPAVGAGRSETLTLEPPPGTLAPQRGAHWLVEAYTADPRALSTSPLVAWPRG
ncbi:MAG TPA: hypothetical protein VLZ77_00745 [Acidimicrobiales bacterium]|nr:hypothetical protein [Acidimicrobiales bacterium]